MNKAQMLRKLSHIASLPLLRKISPPASDIPDPEQLESFLQSQRLAYRSVREVAKLISEGCTEVRAAGLVETYLRDSGVQAFFHRPFAWFGERARFDGMKKYKDYQPTKRALRPGEIFILDVAPIVRGFVSDVGYTHYLGEHPRFSDIQTILKEVRAWIPNLFEQRLSGAQVWKAVETKIIEAGFSNIYQMYPFNVLGHRVHECGDQLPHLGLLHFGWQAFWQISSRGIFGQLLGPYYEGNLMGLWAIEPHIGGDGFGAKFEELLLVNETGARWLEEIPEKAWW